MFASHHSVIQVKSDAHQAGEISKSRQLMVKKALYDGVLLLSVGSGYVYVSAKLRLTASGFDTLGGLL